MSTQYRLVQSGKTASGGCSAGQGSSEPVAPRIYYLLLLKSRDVDCWDEGKRKFVQNCGDGNLGKNTDASKPQKKIC
jgi:hypothetical protein